MSSNSAINRVRSGVPAGGQFAPTQRPAATGHELSEPKNEQSGFVPNDVNWGLLRQQKERLIALAEEDDDLTGIVNLLDAIQDQAAERLGEQAVFGDLDVSSSCEECGAELTPDGESDDDPDAEALIARLRASGELSQEDRLKIADRLERQYDAIRSIQVNLSDSEWDDPAGRLEFFAELIDRAGYAPDGYQ